MVVVAHKRPTRTAFGALVWILLGSLTGCSQLDLSGKGLWPGRQPEPKIPVEMTEIWTDAVRHTPGQPAERGFGGRIMFFARKEGKPVAVDGTLTVYAFDADDKDLKHVAPLKKYVFPVDTLAKHYSKSELGHSYSFWLPWGETGGPEQRVSLIARFEPIGGPILMSQATRHLLPGMPVVKAESPLVKRFRSQDGVRQVAYESPVQGPPRMSMTTATIPLTPSFTRKMLTTPGVSAFGGRAAAFGGQTSTAPRQSLPPIRADVPAAWPTSDPGRAAWRGGYRSSDGPAVRDRGPRDREPPRDYRAEPPSVRLSQARSSRTRFLVQRASSFGRVASPVPSRPRHATWQSSQPPTPQSNWSGQPLGRASVAESRPDPPPPWMAD